MTPQAAVTAVERRLAEVALLGRELEEVAAKSKLLAFNAAIVAAQAGEHGRSFAVVAEQMKALNLRANRAARTLSEQVGHLEAACQALRPTGLTNTT